MGNLERLQMELANRQYLPDDQLKTLLQENGLDWRDEYMAIHRRAILSTVLDVFDILANDIDLFRKVETEFATTTAAFEALSNRMLKIKNKIAEIDAEDGTKSGTCFSSMYVGGL